MSKKKSKLETAVRLPSSDKLFLHDDDSFEEKVLVSLLEEAHGKKLPMKTKIIFTERKLDYDQLPIGYDTMPEYYNSLENYLVYFESEISLEELHELYEKVFKSKFTPEEAEERRSFEMAVMEKRAQGRAAWGVYVSTMGALKVLKAEKEAFQKGGEKGLEEHRKKASKGPTLIYIG